MSGNLRLALPQYLDQVTDADLTPIKEIEQAQAGRIGKSSKQRDKIGRLGRRTHASIIYALTDVSTDGYIRVDVYEENTDGQRHPG